MISQLPTIRWCAIDDRGNVSVHPDHLSATNYVTKPSLHGIVVRLVRADHVEALLRQVFDFESAGKPSVAIEAGA
jgi:hypothetical protein